MSDITKKSLTEIISFIKKKEIKNNWYLIDAENAVVGRLATYISKVLRGKNKATYNPHMDNGDFVIVTNIEKIKFTNSYSFIFSPRPGTVAADLKLVDHKKSKQRLEIIQEKLFNNQIQKNKSLENKVLDVLVENKMKDGIKLFGRTEYMTSVIFDGNIENIGKIVQVEITSSNQNSFFGKLIEGFKKEVA